MNSFLYYTVFLILNIFDTYIIFLFMKLFFKDSFKSKRLMYVFYITYYVVSSLIYIFLSNFLLNLTSSILLVALLTIGYRSKISTKIIATVLAVLTFLTVETVVGVLIGVTNIDPTKHTYYGTELTLLAVSILKYTVVKVISRFRNLNGDIKPPKAFLLISILVPVISVYLEIQLLMQENISEVVYVTSLICVILLNFTVFYLYDSITNLFTVKLHYAAAEQKNAYYKQEAEIMQRNAGELQKLRHDMKNHLIAISELSKAHKDAEVTKYVEALSGKMQMKEEYSSTGILSLDSIINYKLTQAEQSGIRISYEIAVPEEMKIKSDDFVTVIGNLLDNAIEAVSKLQDDKYIYFSMKYTKGTLLITVKNSFNGRVKMNGSRYLTAKNDTKLHGIGLESVRSVIRNYNGDMIITHSNSVFTVKIMLFI